MGQKKKRFYDAVPEFYLNGNGKDVLLPTDYPAEDNRCTTNDVPGSITNDGPYGDNQIEHYL